MASPHEQQIRASVKRLTGAVTPAVMRKAYQSAAREQVRQIRLRNDRGLDVNGKKFKARTAKYMARKPALIRKARGTFRAKSADDYMRLTGALYKSFSFKRVTALQTGKDISGGWTLHVKGPKQRAKLDGLEKNGYYPWGAAKKGTVQRRREDAAIVRAIKRELRVRTGGAVVVAR